MLLSRPPRNKQLACLVEAFWTCESDNSFELERVLPNGRVQLFFNLRQDALHQYNADGSTRQQASGAVVQGPALAPVIIDRAEQGSICGVLFAPVGAFPFFRTPVSEIGSGLIDLDCLSCGIGSALRERLLATDKPQLRLDLLEAAFLENNPVLQDWDAVIAEAAGLLRRGWRVQNLVDRFNTTPQTFIARFLERTGMTPKTYSRIERFQRLIRNGSPASSWAEAALDAGFADQPHMVREFKRFSEITPTKYTPQSIATPNHLPVPT